MKDEELMAVTTYVPRNLVPEFQVKAADWVAAGGSESPPEGSLARSPSDERPDWGRGEFPLAQHLHRKMGNSVAGRVLTILATKPNAPMTGGELAVALGLAADPQDVTGLRKIAGCWGHVGRYCSTAKRELPFQWSDERGYWVTPPTAVLLRKAGF